MNKYQKKLIIIGDSGVYGWGDLEGGGQGSRSVKSVNGNLCLLINFRCDFEASLLMPKTWISSDRKRSHRSLKLQASFVHPGVSSLG